MLPKTWENWLVPLLFVCLGWVPHMSYQGCCQFLEFCMLFQFRLQHAEGSPLIPKASVLHGLEELPKIPQMQGRAKLPTCEPANSTCQPAKAKCIFPIHQPTRRPPHRPTHSSAHAKHQHKSTHTHTYRPPLPICASRFGFLKASTACSYIMFLKHLALSLSL